MSSFKGKYHPEDFKEISLDDIIKELTREQEMRKHFYKRQIDEGRMKRETAVHRFRVFRVLLHLLSVAELNDIEPSDIKNLLETHTGSRKKQQDLFSKPQQPN